MNVPDHLAVQLASARQAVANGADLGNALLTLSKVTSIDPSNSDSYSLMSAAATLLRSGELGAWCAQRATTLNPYDAAAWTNQALYQSAAQKIDCLQRAIAITPADTNALFHLANTSNPDQEQLYQRVLQIDPSDLEAHLNYATLQIKRRPSEALVGLQRAGCIAPGHHLVLNNLSALALDLHNVDTALQSAKRSLYIDPRQPTGWVNLGAALKLLDKPRDAIGALHRCVILDPSDLRGWTNLAALHETEDDSKPSAMGYERAISITPEETTPRFNLGLLKLRHRRLKESWPLYELRQKSLAAQELETRLSNIQQLRALDEAQPGQHVLLVKEQGLGDMIQFIRFYRQLQAHGLTVTLMVPTPLRRLLTQLPASVVTDIDTTTERPYDFWCFIPSLPAICNVDIDDIDGRAYLSTANADFSHKHWGDSTHPVIGIAWRGSAGNQRNPRQIDLQELLQGLPRSSRIAPLHHDLSTQEELALANDCRVVSALTPDTDLADAADLIHACDVIVSIDTALAHLSGALGKRTWLLLPKSADWRWMRGDDSPWYQSLRLFRQAQSANWSDVLTQVREEFAKTFPRGSSQPN